MCLLCFSSLSKIPKGKGAIPLKVIYIDVLIFVNFIVNYFILLATQRICRQRAGTLRIFLADALASACSLAVFLPETGAISGVLLRLAVSSAVVLTAFGFRSCKRFFSLLGGFFAVSFAYAGICFGIWAVFKPKGMIIKNDIVYFDMSPLLLICTSAVCYVLLMLLKKHFSKDEGTSPEYTVEITINGQTSSLKGFLDTGNMLYDCFSECPVIIAKKQYICNCANLSCGNSKGKKRRESVGNGIDSFLSDGLGNSLGDSHGGSFCDNLGDSLGGRFSNEFDKLENLKGFRLIPYSVVGSKGVLPAFMPDRVIIFDEKKEYKPDCCLVALSDEQTGEWEALLGKNIFERTVSRDKISEKAAV